jgi:A/G-specific adenine glycosylase
LVTANAAVLLHQHYVDNFRRLPWRSPPGEGSPDPYRVWLSEVMLQQTTVAAVTERFERFVERWPTIEALAAAEDEDVLGEWAGLGYYARARNLIACAREVVRLGGFPRTAGELIALPGLGAYTAAAIAAIAFGERAAVVDTNIARVIARLYALATPSAEQIRELVLAMTPADRPGDFAQAMMDLGATICRPRAPACLACPLRSECAGFASGAPEAFPAAKAKRSRPLRHGTAWWIERDHHVWLVRRPPRGLLGGMAALPGSEWSAEPRRPSAARLGTVRHVFTHFALELHLERSEEQPEGGWWHPLDRLSEAGLPTLYRRAAELALSRAPMLDEARSAP